MVTIPQYFIQYFQNKWNGSTIGNECLNKPQPNERYYISVGLPINKDTFLLNEKVLANTKHLTLHINNIV